MKANPRHWRTATATAVVIAVAIAASGCGGNAGAETGAEVNTDVLGEQFAAILNQRALNAYAEQNNGTDQGIAYRDLTAPAACTAADDGYDCQATAGNDGPGNRYRVSVRDGVIHYAQYLSNGERGPESTSGVRYLTDQNAQGKLTRDQVAALIGKAVGDDSTGLWNNAFHPEDARSPVDWFDGKCWPALTNTMAGAPPAERRWFCGDWLFKLAADGRVTVVALKGLLGAANDDTAPAIQTFTTRRGTRTTPAP